MVFSKLATDNPCVSVVITCYNYGKYIEEAVDSVFKQTYPNIEVIIINDGSKDNSDEVIKELTLKYPNIKYHQQKNKGVIYTRNKAIELSRGEYIIQLDADDYLQSDYIEKFTNCALQHGADVVYGDYQMFGASSGRSNFPDFNLERLKNGNFINISSLIKVSAIGTVKFDDGLNNQTHEDWDFFLGLSLKGCKIIKCSDSLLYYRIHDSGRNNKMITIEDRLHFIRTYTYIVDKYSKIYPDDFSYLFGLVYSSWFIGAISNNISLQNSNKELQDRYNTLVIEYENVQLEITALKNSRSWRLTSVLRFLGKIFSITYRKRIR